MDEKTDTKEGDFMNETGTKASGDVEKTTKVVPGDKRDPRITAISDNRKKTGSFVK